MLHLRVEHERRANARAVAVFDVDLHADGGDPGVSAGRTVPGGQQMSASLDPSLDATPGVGVHARAMRLSPSCWWRSRFCRSIRCATGDTFVLTLFTRVLILAIGAVSLNLIMGYGGMVSFGHAAYLGIGGYAVGILAKEGIGFGLVQWPVAIAASALYALAVGALSLRTRGVYFIMITLAFAQMIYYVAIGLDRYGGDDGLTIYKRSDFGGVIDLNNKTRILLSVLCDPAREHLSGLRASSIRASAW